MMMMMMMMIVIMIIVSQYMFEFVRDEVGTKQPQLLMSHRAYCTCKLPSLAHIIMP